MGKVVRAILILMPYIFIFCCYKFSSSSGVIDDFVLLKIILFIAAFCVIIVILLVIVNVTSVKAKKLRMCAIGNLILKIAYVPLHLFMFFLFRGFLNPWLLFFSWIPLVFSIAFEIVSAAASIGCIVKSVISKKISIGKGILFGIFAFFPVLDLIGAFILIFSIKNEKTA